MKRDPYAGIYEFMKLSSVQQNQEKQGKQMECLLL